MLPIVTEGGPDLTASVLVATKFSFQGPVTEVIKTNARIVTRYEKLHGAFRVIAWQNHRIDSGDLTALGIAAPCGANMDVSRGF